ncbi:MAG: hypothetical protein C4533_01580 [Candidatus Omnitrophota bacterium]|jgi:hypothetical protein|nr:MAG: hypothetical protein C4533_01580 [Candidatus Omnitrophota bacterium]
MKNLDLEKNAIKGIREAIAWHTIIVDVSLANTSLGWGTGTLLEINSRKFILTCAHVVKKEYKNKDLRFIYRSGNSLRDADKDIIKEAPLNDLVEADDKAYSLEIPTINRFYSDFTDDLVMLELEPTAKTISNFVFFDASIGRIISPEIGMATYMLGFSVELTREINKYGVGNFHYFLGSKIIDFAASDRSIDYNRQFFIDYSIDDHSVDLHGLSGCGVWTRKPSGKNNLWSPNLYLVGVQDAFITVTRKFQPIRATRGERITDLINKTI